MINTQQLVSSTNNSLLDICGEFSYRLLAKNKLLEIAEDIICLKPLNKAQAKTLLNVSPPLLLKLAELRKSTKKTNLLTPVLYLPLACSLRNSPASTIIDVFSEEIQLHLKTLEKLSIALDNFSTDSSNEKFDSPIFVETLKNIFSQFSEKLELYSFNTKTISNTSCIQILGFKKQDRKHRDRCFLNQLLEIQKIQTLESWEPQFNYQLDKLPLQENAALGLEILSKICLARLALPHVKIIKAPLSILGLNLANVALQFGANHLGFAAVNENSAKNLQLPLYQRTLKEIENV